MKIDGNELAIRQNNLSDDAPVTPGMVLKLPAGSVQAQ